MAGNPEYQDVHQASPPSPITPAGGPSSPADYAGVTPHGRGPAPYDIQAPLMADEVQSAFSESVAVGGSGVLYPMGERIQQAQTMLESPQGFGLDGFDVDGGFHGGQGGDAGWPNNVEPPGM